MEQKLEKSIKPELSSEFTKFLERRTHQGFFVGVTAAISIYIGLGWLTIISILSVSTYFVHKNIPIMAKLEADLKKEGVNLAKVYRKLSNNLGDLGVFIPTLALVLFGILEFNLWYLIMVALVIFSVIRIIQHSKTITRLLSNKLTKDEEKEEIES